MSSERPLFFYGSLRHRALLDIVVGRPVPDADVSDAHLDNSEVRVAGQDAFPLIVVGEGNGAAGIVVDGVTENERARLNFYEGDEEYLLQTVQLRDGREADCYLPGQKLGAPGALWDFDVWCAEMADFTCFAAADYMQHFGVIPEAQADALWPAIQKRAWAQVLARKHALELGNFSGAVDILEHQRAYSGFFALDDLRLRHEDFAGRMTAPMERAVFIGMDVALVLPYDPVRDRVMLVEQIRMGPFLRGDPSIWQVEPVAGHIDPGETPRDAARRETLEETGCDPIALEEVAQAYPSPGASTEHYFMYVGLTDLPDHSAGQTGVESEGEHIRTHLLSFDDFLAMLEAGRITVAPLVALGYWLAFHRTRLRNAARS